MTLETLVMQPLTVPMTWLFSPQSHKMFDAARKTAGTNKCVKNHISNTTDKETVKIHQSRLVSFRNAPYPCMLRWVGAIVYFNFKMGVSSGDVWMDLLVPAQCVRLSENDFFTPNLSHETLKCDKSPKSNLGSRHQLGTAVALGQSERASVKWQHLALIGCSFRG